MPSLPTVAEQGFPVSIRSIWYAIVALSAMPARCDERAGTVHSESAHSTDRGHSFQTDCGQRSRRSRTRCVGCLSDGSDGRPTVRHQFGTLSAIGVERGPAGLSTQRPGAGWTNPVPKAFSIASLFAASALSTAAASPATNSRRGGQGGPKRYRCSGAPGMPSGFGPSARRSDSPFSARVCDRAAAGP